MNQRLASSPLAVLGAFGLAVTTACIEPVDRGGTAPDNPGPTPAPMTGTVINPPTPAPMPPTPAPEPPSTLPPPPPVSFPPLVGRPTPPLSGGTLLVLANGKTAIAADADNDAIHVADLTSERALGHIALDAGDEPGRSVEDARGRVHVILRGGGAVATLDPLAAGAPKLLSRRAVCPAPRGIAFDRAADRLVVACAGGELAMLGAEGGDAEIKARLPRDLRDVVITGGKIFVSQFRSAELFELGADGTVAGRRRPPGSKMSQLPVTAVPGPMQAPSSTPPPPGLTAAGVNVAWRTIASPSGAIAMVHQESSNGELGTSRGGYFGGPCKTPIAAAVSVFAPGKDPVTSGQIMFGILPIDLAISPSGKRAAVVTAGNSFPAGPRMGPPVTMFSMEDVGIADQGCMSPGTMPPPEPIESGGTVESMRQPTGSAIALAFDGKGRLIAQTREPAGIEILTVSGKNIALASNVRNDQGHMLFHRTTMFGLSCASCHPEASDDGRTWRFQTIGPRRTQDLRGGLLDTAPFHWDGDMLDLGHLMQTVFTGRMGGGSVAPTQIQALGSWLHALPMPKHTPPADLEAVARGKAVFEGSAAACTKCHSGARFTNNSTVDVGTGRKLQVPSLKGVAWRFPFMHTGCAPTLADRFDAKCGGGDLHGTVSSLSAAQIKDLVAFMETL